MKKYTVTVEEDENGELVIPFTDEIMRDAGLAPGDTLRWKIQDDNTVTLSKVEPEEESEWVLVDTVQTYRLRYLVEVPKGRHEWALDTVTMNEAKEFSQLSLGETVYSYRVITEEEGVKQFRQDNNYGKSWDDDLVKKNSFTYRKEYMK